MKKLTLLLLTGLLALPVIATPADDVADHEGWMKTAQATVGSVRKNLQTPAAEEAAKDAQKLVELFKNIEGFWAKRKVEDAVGWAKQAQTAAGEVAKAAQANDLAKAGESMRGVMGTCMACHNAHRERLPDGSFKIK